MFKEVNTVGIERNTGRGKGTSNQLCDRTVE